MEEVQPNDNQQPVSGHQDAPPKGSSKQPSMKVVLTALVMLMVLAAAFLALKFDKKPARKTANNATSTATVINQAEVTITKDGFVPATIQVRTGQSVNWTNLDDAMHQVAADPHPTHSSLSDLVGESLSKSESYSFVFEKTGTYTYHDELNPLKFHGTVIVK